MASKNTAKAESGKKVMQDSPASLFPAGLSSLGDIDRIFDDYFNRNWFRQMRPGFSNLGDLWGTYEMRSPSMDVIDREKDILVRAELPGVDKKDLDVSVHDNMLTIKGESKYESTQQKDEYYSSEIKKGSFARSLMLPNNVDSDNINAEFKNGLLEISLPKTGTSKKQTVNVK